jgi:hypothetical protein
MSIKVSDISQISRGNALLVGGSLSILSKNFESVKSSEGFIF